MNIKLYQAGECSMQDLFNFKIEASFPTQKRTICAAHVCGEYVLQEKTFFLQFPKLIFKLVHGIHFKLIALNEKNEELNLIIPNVFARAICLGTPVYHLIKNEDVLKFNQNPNANTAKNIIMPIIDEFWNSKFTVSVPNLFNNLIETFNNSKKILYNRADITAYHWTLLEESK